MTSPFTKIVFIVHGRIRRPEFLEKAIRSRFAASDRLLFFRTRYREHAIALSCTAVKKGATHLICIGGDGSMNEMVNGVMQARNEGADISSLRVGLYPAGTGNDFARTFGIREELEQLRLLIREDRYRPVDLGFIQFRDTTGRPSQRYFINITDLGMGGVIAQKLDRYGKWMGPSLMFQRAIVSTLLSYKKIQVRIKGDGLDYEGPITNLVIANGKYFGNGLGIAPDANPHDGMFSIVVIGKISMKDYIRLQGVVKKCRLLDHPEVHYYSTRELVVETTGPPAPIDMDGEFIGYNPLEARVVPEVLKLLSP